MRLTDAIARADSLRPNTLDMSLKVSWVYELEGEIAEALGIECPPNLYPLEDENYPELLMPFPKENIYVLYLCAMIDFANEETALYENDMAMANAQITDAKKWLVRNNKRTRPAQYIHLWGRGERYDTTEDAEQDTTETEPGTETRGD